MPEKKPGEKAKRNLPKEFINPFEKKSFKTMSLRDIIGSGGDALKGFGSKSKKETAEEEPEEEKSEKEEES